MRTALLPLVLLFVACSGGGDTQDPPPDTDTDTDTDDTGRDTATTLPIRYDIEVVHSATFPDLQGVAAAFVNPVNGYTYVLDEPTTMIRYLLDTWVYPTGDWCVGGTEDDDGTCRGEGVVWTSGRIESPKPTQSICHDPDLGLLYELKGGGENIEVIDIAMEGGEPYTYNRAVGNPDVPPELSSSGSYVTGCDVVRTDGSLVLISAGYRAMAVVGTGASSLTANGMRLLEFEPDDLTVSGSTAFMIDRTHNRLMTVDLDGLAFAGSYQPDTTIADLAVERSTGTAWVALGDSGVARVVFENGEATVTTFDTEGAARQVVTDDTRHVAWVAIESDGAWSVALLDEEGIRGSVPVGGEVLRMADPAPGGDVPVFYRTTPEEPIAYDVLAPMPDRQEIDPLNIFLFTTIEEPSDVNMTLPCSGAGTTFDTEMSLVRNNAAVLASLGVPVVMAITDNFAEKAEECGQTAIFQELVDYGFELGVMLHNRPCYNCQL